MKTQMCCRCICWWNLLWALMEFTQFLYARFFNKPNQSIFWPFHFHLWSRNSFRKFYTAHTLTHYFILKWFLARNPYGVLNNLLSRSIYLKEEILCKISGYCCCCYFEGREKQKREKISISEGNAKTTWPDGVNMLNWKWMEDVREIYQYQS